MAPDELLQKVLALDPDLTVMEDGTDRPTVVVPVTKLLPVAKGLRDTPGLEFQLLTDHVCIDWVDDGRFELIYQLDSLSQGHDLRVSCSVPRDQPVAPSLSSVWAIAEWQEREVFDLMGIHYVDHPDLRRLFLEDGWEGFPLRKDYKDDYMISPSDEVTS